MHPAPYLIHRMRHTLYLINHMRPPPYLIHRMRQLLPTWLIICVLLPTWYIVCVLLPTWSYASCLILTREIVCVLLPTGEIVWVLLPCLINHMRPRLGKKFILGLEKGRYQALDKKVQITLGWKILRFRTKYI